MLNLSIYLTMTPKLTNDAQFTNEKYCFNEQFQHFCMDSNEQNVWTKAKNANYYHAAATIRFKVKQIQYWKFRLRWERRTHTHICIACAQRRGPFMEEHKTRDYKAHLIGATLLLLSRIICSSLFKRFNEIPKLKSTHTAHTRRCYAWWISRKQRSHDGWCCGSFILASFLKGSSSCCCCYIRCS